MSAGFMSFPPYSLPYQLLLCPPTPSQIYDPFLSTPTTHTLNLLRLLSVTHKYMLPSVSVALTLISSWKVQFQGVRHLDTLSL